MINGDEKIEHDKDFLKIRFESNDDLPMNKPIKLRLLTIIIRLVLVKMVNFTFNYFQMMHFMNYENTTVSKT